ncbi:hypothetical protein, partial [Maribacter sp. 2307UL18-2]|uniref:hypothetical protein n=1 Tax=Maribacter sp. 2307UL18-2 TaxID=3386274 RepID=UPI0039BD32CA
MEALLLELRNNNIDITVIDGKIELNIPEGLEVLDLIERIRVNKKKLLEYLEENCLTRKNIQKAPSRDYYDLSAAQRRLYFLYEMDRSSLAYNLPRLIELK